MPLKKVETPLPCGQWARVVFTCIDTNDTSHAVQRARPARPVSHCSVRTLYFQRGLVPRCIADIFNEIRVRSQVSITARISYLEIYNENFYDLLAPEAKADIQLQEDAKGAVQVKGVSSHVISRLEIVLACSIMLFETVFNAHEEDALSLLFEGETNRAIAEHQLNKDRVNGLGAKDRTGFSTLPISTIEFAKHTTVSMPLPSVRSIPSNTFKCLREHQIDRSPFIPVHH
eukprot:1179916-Prorocentrum_minimum.AAC.2